MSTFLCLRMTNTKKKKKNFSEPEIEVLLAEVEVHAGCFLGAFPVGFHTEKKVRGTILRFIKSEGDMSPAYSRPMNKHFL